MTAWKEENLKKYYCLLFPPPSWCGWPRCGAEEADTEGSCGKATAAPVSSTPRSSPAAPALLRCNTPSALPERSWRGRWRSSQTLCLDQTLLRRQSPLPGRFLAEQNVKSCSQMKPQKNTWATKAKNKYLKWSLSVMTVWFKSFLLNEISTILKKTPLSWVLAGKPLAGLFVSNFCIRLTGKNKTLPELGNSRQHFCTKWAVNSFNTTT